MSDLDNQGVRQRIENESGGDQWSIELHAYEILDTIFTDPIVHYEIVFVDPNGELNNVINGHPFEKGSGDYAGGFRAASDENVLQAVYGSNTSFGDITGDQPLTVFKLWQGGTSEFYELRNRAREAGAVINEMDVDYIIIDAFRDAQNSNSIAGTIIQAMGLDIPHEASSLWAPGIDRHLLPSDFQSYFDFFPITDENFAEFLGSQPGEDRAGIHDGYTTVIFNPLGINRVIENAKELSRPEEGESLRAFDPNAHSTPDIYGVSAAHSFMHENGINHSFEGGTLGMQNGR
ncbi:MAG: hypothetical protein AB8B83_08930 [Bdellovibrionales bacterium]